MVRIDIPTFNSISVDSNVTDSQASNANVSETSGNISQSYSGQSGNQYGGFSSSETETMSFDNKNELGSTYNGQMNVTQKDGVLSNDSNPNSSTYVQSNSSSQSTGIGSPTGTASNPSTAPKSTNNINISGNEQNSGLGGNNNMNSSTSQSNMLNGNNNSSSQGLGDGRVSSNPSTTTPSGVNGQSNMSSTLSGSMNQPQTPSVGAQQQEGNGIDSNTNMAAGTSTQMTQVPSISTVDSNTKLVITQVDENNNPIEVEVTFGELVQMFRDMGLCDADIDRLLSGEIELGDLINEILLDSEHPERRINLGFATVLSQMDYNGAKSLDDLQNMIIQANNQINAINQQRYDIYRRELEYYVLQQIVLELEYGNSLDWILQREVPVIVHVDENGVEHYQFYNMNCFEVYYDSVADFGTFRPSKDEAGDDVEVRTVSFEEIIANDPRYQQLSSYVVTKEEPQYFLFWSWTTTETALIDSPETNEFIDSLRKEYSDFQENDRVLLDKLDREVRELNASISETQYHIEYLNQELNYQFDYILQYTLAPDFEIKNSYNEECSKTMDYLYEHYSGWASNYSPYPSLNGADYVVTIADKTQVVHIVSAIINGKTSISGGLIFIDGNTFKLESDERIIENYSNYASLMTDTEISVFNCILNTEEGVDAAYDWLLGVYDELDQRWLANKVKEDQAFADKHPYLSSFLSIFVKPIEGINSIIYSMSDLALGYQIRRINVYSSSDVWRETVGNKIAADIAKKYVNRLGYDSLEVAPADVLEDALSYGERGAFLYNTGMSMADSVYLVALTLPLGGAGGAVAKVGSVVISFAVMGTSAYASTLNDALDRGLSDGRAVALAWASAVTETAMESWSLGHLMNLEKYLGKGVLSIANSIDNKFLKGLFYIGASAISQGIQEAEEEVCTEIINSFWDDVISGDLSNFHLTVENYISQGYSENEATILALQGSWKQIKLSALGGFISGLTFGLFGGGVNLHKMHYNMAMDIMNQYEGTESSMSKLEALRSVDINDVINEITNQNVQAEQLKELQDAVRKHNMKETISTIKAIAKGILLEGQSTEQLTSSVLNAMSDSSITINSLGINKNNVNSLMISLTSEQQRQLIDTIYSRLISGEVIDNVTFNAIFTSELFTAESSFARDYLHNFLVSMCDGDTRLADKVSNIYDSARKSTVSQKLKDLYSYCDHTEAHTLQVAFLSVKALNAISSMAESNSHYAQMTETEYKEIFVAGLLHDLGMAAGTVIDGKALMNGTNIYLEYLSDTKDAKIKAEIIDFNAKDLASIVRNNHTLNSATAILALREELEAIGLNPDRLAMLCFSHSKSNSGVGILTSANDWSLCVAKIQEAVTVYNSQLSEGQAEIHLDLSSIGVQSSEVDAKTDSKQKTNVKGAKVQTSIKSINFVEGFVSQMATKAFALRVGDAFVSKAKIKLKSPISWNYNGVIYTATEAILTQTGNYMLYDKSKSAHELLKNNNSQDTETYDRAAFAYFTLNSDGDLVPCKMVNDVLVDAECELVDGVFQITDESGLMSLMGAVKEIIKTQDGTKLETKITDKDFFEYESKEGDITTKEYYQRINDTYVVKYTSETKIVENIEVTNYYKINEDGTKIEILKTDFLDIVGTPIRKSTGQFLAGESNVSYNFYADVFQNMTDGSEMSGLISEMIVGDMGSFPYNAISKGLDERFGELAGAVDIKRIVNIKFDNLLDFTQNFEIIENNGKKILVPKTKLGELYISQINLITATYKGIDVFIEGYKAEQVSQINSNDKVSTQKNIESSFDTNNGLLGKLATPRKANFNLFSTMTTKGINSFFANFDRTGWNYGADQGFLDQQYHENPSTMSKVANEEYFRLKDKLKRMGFTSRSASMIISGLDSVGACSYAAIANGIFNAFKNDSARFEQIFGYKMTTTVNGQTILNTGELLLDLYTFINNVSNGGKLFSTNPDGTLTVLEVSLKNRDMFGRMILDADGQQYLSGFYGISESIISKFLKSKSSNISIDLNTIARFDGSYLIDNNQMQQIVTRVVQSLNSGKNVHLGIYSAGNEIRLLGLDNRTPNYSTRTWSEGGGHATFVTEVRSDGFVVSSWGKRLLIPFSDLQNGAQFLITEWDINSSKMRMTQADMQLSDIILNAFNIQYQKYGSGAVNYIMNFLNTGNFNAITRDGNARASLQQYSYSQILYVVNNFIDINNILTLMSNNSF